MIKTALLSVIIPVYNVEPYLEQCLDSVVNQTYKNLEIICINDGSTDNSLKILEKYQKKDNRMKIIDQKNKGVAAARNAGLDAATGEYITFVDSDDYLELNAYEEAMKVMLKTNNVDIVEFNVNVFSEDSNPVTINRTNCTAKFFENIFNAKASAPSVWNKVFKFDRIKKMNIRFPNGLVNDDTFFSTAAVMCSNNTTFINIPFYNYRIFGNSITGTQANSPRAMHIYYNYDALVEFAKIHNVLEKYKNLIYSRYIGSVGLFCNDKERLLYSIKHWDKKILDSDCQDDLKLKYIKKRDEIAFQINCPFEYKLCRLYSNLMRLFGKTHKLEKFAYKTGPYMAYIHDKEKFHKEHFPYFALNWHKFEYENISRYKYVIDSPEPEFQRTPELENKIWMLWLQGEENAPDIVKASINSVRKHANGREVIVLNKDTVKKYTKLPDYVWKKYEEGKMTAAHFAVMLRLDLLCRYGGTWIDATVLLEDKIPDDILNSDVFMFQLTMEQPMCSRKYHLLENWFIHSNPHNKAIRLCRDILFEYWKYNDSQYTYLLAYSALTLMIRHCNVNYIKMPTYKFHFCRLSREKYSYDSYKYLTRNLSGGLPIIKMCHKAMPGHPPKGSIADYICRKYNVKCDHEDGYR